VKYYIISGEASGDLQCSQLIHALKNLDSEGDFRAWGGDLMQKEGAVLVKHYRELAFMGFWEVVSHLPTILKNISFCKKDILRYMPDVIIYVDYPGFNLRIAKWAKNKGFKNHYYISPQVWAWKENRIKQMKATLDSLYVILPFEKNYFEQKHNFPVHYVGHPLMDQLSKYSRDPKFCKKNNLTPKKPIIALLPGSRVQEIRKMLPLFNKIAAKFKKFQFVVAGAPGIDPKEYNKFMKSNSLNFVHEKTYQLLLNSCAALVTSGTATLETALLNIPQLVCYKCSPITYWIGKKVIKLKYISLVNLILEKEAVVELIQNDCTYEKLVVELETLLQKNSLEKMNQNYIILKEKIGGSGASEKTAKLIFNSIRNNNFKN
jgi:lipid-A-disaccharide synthase